MSKFWNPEWQKQSVLYDITPTPEELEHLLKNPPPDFGHSYIGCPFSIVLLQAGVGPDYVALVRADRRNKAAWLQQQVGRFTWYFICDRPRIVADADGCSVEDGKLFLTFLVSLDDGSTETLRCSGDAGDTLVEIEVTEEGRTLVQRSGAGGEMAMDATLYAQHCWKQRPTGWPPSCFELRVRYIGQGQGRDKESCALDRLEAHATYQKLLEEATATSHTREIWLMLGSGTDVNVGLAAMADADPASLPAAKPIVARARQLMSTAKRIDLVEALLINYFGPDMNKQHVPKLNPRAGVFTPVRDADISDVTLFLDSGELGVSLFSDRAPAREHHAATLCMNSKPFRLQPV